MSDLKGKKVVVLGLGVENLPLVKFLVKRGAEVTVRDQRKDLGFRIKDLGIKDCRLGGEYLKNLTDFELIFRTPGLSRLTPELLQAELKGVEISSATKLFFDLCPAKIIGIAGTKGKGTCASLIQAMLKSKIKNKRSKIYLGGNIGQSPFDFLDKLKPSDWVILELSSFQLQDLQKSPHITVVLDITSDHLDHHKTRREYIKAKENIVRFQTKKDFAVINQDYFTSFRFAALTKARVYYFSRKKSVDEGAFVRWSGRSGEVILRKNGANHLICPTYEIDLIGLHNLENICAAVVASYLAGAKIKDIQKVVTTFKGLEHRLELVAKIDGVKYFNDSFSTTPETTMAAISSFSEPLVLIVGGRSKGGDYDKIVRAILKSSVKGVILIGETARHIEDVAKSKIKNLRLKSADQPKRLKKSKIKFKIKNLGYATMNNIVKAAQRESKPGDIVLLSPGCTSFDMFKNASERGEQFKQTVKALSKQ